MVNELIDGISLKLNYTFGDGFRIYSENVTQGLQEPCFFISALNPSQSQIIGNRFRSLNPFVINYFPASLNPNIEMHSMAIRLFDALEYITLNGDPVRGTRMHYSINDDVLQFFVDYNLFVLKHVIPADDMGTLTIKSNVKG